MIKKAKGLSSRMKHEVLFSKIIMIMVQYNARQ